LINYININKIKNKLLTMMNKMKDKINKLFLLAKFLILKINMLK